MIVWAGYWFIRLLGPTLRVSVSYEEGAQKTLDQGGAEKAGGAGDGDPFAGQRVGDHAICLPSGK